MQEGSEKKETNERTLLKQNVVRQLTYPNVINYEKIIQTHASNN